jgi:hypothetical protein
VNWNGDRNAALGCSDGYHFVTDGGAFDVEEVGLPETGSHGDGDRQLNMLRRALQDDAILGFGPWSITDVGVGARPPDLLYALSERVRAQPAAILRKRASKCCRPSPLRQ